MARPRKHWPMVEASRDEASLAVRLYNDPAEARSFESFIVHMHLAWLYMLQAEFTRDDVDYRYWRRDRPDRLEKVDGEPKRWDLARSVRERWPDDKNPVRANVDFFIRLRNRVEHRYAREQQAMSAAVSGHAQALLLNYEAELTAEFGTASSLATRLRFPVFVGSFTTEGEQALRKLRRTLPAAVRTFIVDYDGRLDASVTDDPRYEFRLRVTQELAPKDPDALAIQFSRYDDMTDEQKAAVEQLGRKGAVVIKERLRNVAGADEVSPKQVVIAVQARVPYRFTMDDFHRAWKTLEVRPPGKDPHPERTDERYCTYYPRHGDYGYRPAYIEKLVRECSTAEGFAKLTGKPVRDKDSGAVVPPQAQQPGPRVRSTPGPPVQKQVLA